MVKRTSLICGLLLLCGIAFAADIVWIDFTRPVELSGNTWRNVVAGGSLLPAWIVNPDSAKVFCPYDSPGTNAIGDWVNDADATIFCRNGAGAGALTFLTNYNGTYSSDGGDFGTFGTNTATFLNGATALTFTVAFRPAASIVANDGILTGRGSDGVYGFVSSPDGGLIPEFRVSGASLAGSSTAMTTNKWHILTGTWQQGGTGPINIYLDGALKGAGVYNSTAAIIDDFMYLAADDFAAARRAPGIYDIPLLQFNWRASLVDITNMYDGIMATGDYTE